MASATITQTLIAFFVTTLFSVFSDSHCDTTPPFDPWISSRCIFQFSDSRAWPRSLGEAIRMSLGVLAAFSGSSKCICFLPCVTNHNKFSSSLQQLFVSSQVCRSEDWALCLGSHWAEIKVSYGLPLTWSSAPASKLIWIIGRTYSLHLWVWGPCFLVGWQPGAALSSYRLPVSLAFCIFQASKRDSLPHVESPLLGRNLSLLRAHLIRSGQPGILSLSQHQVIWNINHTCKIHSSEVATWIFDGITWRRCVHQQGGVLELTSSSDYQHRVYLLGLHPLWGSPNLAQEFFIILLAFWCTLTDLKRFGPIVLLFPSGMVDPNEYYYW